MVLGAVTVVNRDAGRGAAAGPYQVARYLAVVADLDPTTELPDGFARRVRTWSRPDGTRPPGR